jgi:hypothetical protein
MEPSNRSSVNTYSRQAPQPESLAGVSWNMEPVAAGGKVWTRLDKDSSRARAVLPDSCSMLKTRLALLMGAVMGLVATVNADQNEIFSNLRTSSVHLAAVGLSDAAPLSLSTAFLAPSAVSDFLPALPASGPATSARMANISATMPAQDYSKDYSKEAIPTEHHRLFDYATGEVGFIYGASTGKFSSDFEQGYIQGTVGNEHMQISAGASYENYNQKLPRFVR